MSESSKPVHALLREALEHDGRIALAKLAQELVPLEELRALARQHALSPKGYRAERAPAPRLVPLLADPRRPDVVEALVTLIVERHPPPVAAGDGKRTEELEALLRLRESELTAVRAELSRCRSQAARHREREAEQRARVEAAEERTAAARAEVEAVRRLGGSRNESVSGRDEQARRIRELEREVETFTIAEEQLRRMVALRQARLRELEEQVADLQQRVPKGRKPHKEKLEAPRLADHFRVPHFTPSFYKSLENKERRHVEQAVQAALLFCTEGPSYPGLEVKQIEGQELWSLRASLKLRVYFVFRHDGAVEFLAVADREDQHTMLRRLKER